MRFFVFRFVPYKPDLPTSMTAAEAATMAEHGAYWQALADRGTAVVFGPVADPAGAWGVAIVEVATEAAAQAIRAADPVVRADLGPVEIHPMPVAITRQAPAAAGS
ncbi:MAG TPA: YciI family protein [Actinophytocola sp.]|nr:YciI family protein [Actinophytocola sp.]